jgi:hypothetical protein
MFRVALGNPGRKARKKAARVTANLHPAFKASLKRLAEQEQCSLSEMVGMLLHEAMDRRLRPTPSQVSPEPSPESVRWTPPSFDELKRLAAQPPFVPDGKPRRRRRRKGAAPK